MQQEGNITSSHPISRSYLKWKLSSEFIQNSSFFDSTFFRRIVGIAYLLGSGTLFISSIYTNKRNIKPAVLRPGLAILSAVTTINAIWFLTQRSLYDPRYAQVCLTKAQIDCEKNQRGIENIRQRYDLYILAGLLTDEHLRQILERDLIKGLNYSELHHKHGNFTSLAKATPLRQTLRELALSEILQKHLNFIQIKNNYSDLINSAILSQNDCIQHIKSESDLIEFKSSFGDVNNSENDSKHYLQQDGTVRDSTIVSEMINDIAVKKKQVFIPSQIEKFKKKEITYWTLRDTTTLTQLIPFIEDDEIKNQARMDFLKASYKKMHERQEDWKFLGINQEIIKFVINNTECFDYDSFRNLHGVEALKDGMISSDNKDYLRDLLMEKLSECSWEEFISLQEDRKLIGITEKEAKERRWKNKIIIELTKLEKKDFISSIESKVFDAREWTRQIIKEITSISIFTILKYFPELFLLNILKSEDINSKKVTFSSQLLHELRSIEDFSDLYYQYGYIVFEVGLLKTNSRYVRNLLLDSAAFFLTEQLSLDKKLLELIEKLLPSDVLEIITYYQTLYKMNSEKEKILTAFQTSLEQFK
jgi:hypothetical protein